MSFFAYSRVCMGCKRPHHIILPRTLRDAQPGRINLNRSTTRHRARPRHKFGFSIKAQGPAQDTCERIIFSPAITALLPFLTFLETTITLTTVAGIMISTFLDIQYPIPSLTFLQLIKFLSLEHSTVFSLCARRDKARIQLPPTTFTSAYTD